MNRRDFLVSATGLLCLQSLSRAQNKPVTVITPTDDIVLEDFENGGTRWTFSGNCWGKGPTAASRYRDRISNYQGEYYLLSALAGTGVATSPEYPLSKMYLKFKIAGGSSHDTRVELLVDGRLDRWLVGNDSLAFEDVCIDLTHLKGEKLTIKVIDESTDREWGLLLVDYFRLSDKPTQRYYKTPKDFGIESHLIQDCTFFRTSAERDEGRHLPVGLSPRQFDYVINEVYKRMIMQDMDHVPGISAKRKSEYVSPQSVVNVASKIRQAIDQVLKRLDIQDRPPLLRKWLLAEGVCGWVSTHLTFNDCFKPGTHIVDVERLSIDPLSQQVPETNCSGFTRLTQALSLELGLDCRHAVGDFRGVTQSTGGRHSWVYYDFGDGVFSVADNVEAQTTLKGARDFPGKGRWDAILPKSPIELELFLARHHSYQRLEGSFDKEVYIDTLDCALFHVPYAVWKMTDTSDLKDIEVKYLQYQAQLARALSAIRNIKTIHD